jgi:hypothetical protein
MRVRRPTTPHGPWQRDAPLACHADLNVGVWETVSGDRGSTAESGQTKGRRSQA